MYSTAPSSLPHRPVPSSFRRQSLWRIGVRVMALVGLLLPLSSRASNDNFVDALRLDLNGRINIDTTNYSRENGEAGAGGTNARTAWFVWTAPEGTPMRVRFSTYGSNYDTVFNLYKRDAATPALLTSLTAITGAPENPQNVDNDTNITVNQGTLTWDPQAGTTYYISVGRNGGGGGNSTLEATFGAVLTSTGGNVIPNDNIANAFQIITPVTTPTTQIPRGQEVPGTTIGASTETGEQIIGGSTAPKGGTVWYRYRTSASPEVFSVVLSGLPADALTTPQIILQAFTNTVSPSVPTFAQLTFAEEDQTSSLLGEPRLVINGAANTEYYFRVTSTDGDGVLFNIRLDFNPVAPSNDNIVNAIALNPSLPSVRNQGEDIYSANQTDPTGFNGNTSGANVWYSWKAPATGLVRIRAIAPSPLARTGNFHPLGSTFKFDAEVYYDTTNPTDTTFDTNNQQSAASFNEGTNPQERTFFAIQDVVYFIEIGGDNNINTAGRGFFGFVLEDAHVTEVARTGVSYGSEGVLKTIKPPVVNRTGDIAFEATFEVGGPVTAGKAGGLFLYNGASTRVTVTKGMQEFATPLDIDGDGIKDDKVVFNAFSNLFLADRTAGGDTNADLGFNSTLSGTSNDEPVNANNNKAFYHADPANGGTREFRLNDYVTDALTSGDGGGFLGGFNTPVRETGDNTALVTGKMVGIPIVRNTGLFASTREVVVQEEDPAPNTQDGVEFGEWTGVASVNSSDNLAFRAVLRGTGINATNDIAIYSVADYNQAPTALNYHLRLRKGSAIPGAPGSTVAGGASILTLGDPRVNSRGRIATLVSLKPTTGAPAVTAANDTAIVSDLVTVDDAFALVVREGDPAKNASGQSIAGVRFVSFSAPILITNNAVVFTAKVAGTGVTATNDTGIWIWDGTATYLVARKGDTASGVLPAGAKFKTLGTPLANASGRVAFTASLLGTGVTTQNDAGLWTVNEDGVKPALRLRKGDTYNFGSTELPVQRKITSIAVTPGSGGDDGSARGMDQDGFVAVQVGLNKGTAPSGQAVFKVAP